MKLRCRWRVCLSTGSGRAAGVMRFERLDDALGFAEDLRGACGLPFGAVVIEQVRLGRPRRVRLGVMYW